MRYFRFKTSDSDKIWRKYKYKVFGDDFFENNDVISIESLFEKKRFKKPPVIEVLVNGVNPEFSSVGADCIVVSQKVLNKDDFNFSGITLIPLIEPDTSEMYYAFCFDEAVDCVDFEHSDYNLWSNGEKPSNPCENPLAVHFRLAALDSKRIPEHLDGFTLKNWGGAFNFVVNERVKDKLLTLEKADILLMFTEMQVV